MSDLRTEGPAARAAAEPRLLLEALSRLREAFTITDAAINPPGPVFIYVNSAFERMTGYRAEELVGKTPRILQGKGTDRRVLDRLRRCLEEGRPFSGETVNYRKDGTGFLMRWYVDPIRDREGRITHYFAVQRDVTEERRLESIAAAQNLHDHLGAVFAGVRHELGNPVNSLKAALQVVTRQLDSLAGDQLMDYLGRMSDEVDRIESLLRSLRSYSLYDRPEPEILELAPFLDRFQKIIGPDLLRDRLDLSIRVNEEAATVWVDPQALHQVLLNLVVNASRALEGQAGGRIEIETMVVELQRIAVVVRDNGPGIPEEHRKRIFEPFYTTRAGGAGLGLAISKNLMVRNRGDLDVDSSAAGTEARLLLSREPPPEGAGAEER